MVDNKIRHVLVTNHVHDSLINEDLTRTGLYQWVNVFESDVKRVQDLKHDLTDDMYDIIQVNLSSQDLHVVNELVDILGEDRTTKIVVNNDYTSEMWNKAFVFPYELKSAVEKADMIFGTEPYQIDALTQILQNKRKVYYISHPCNVKRLKCLPTKIADQSISVIWHRYDNFSYIPSLAVNNHGLKTRLIGYDVSFDKNNHVTEALYNDVWQGCNHFDFISQLQRSKIVYDPFTYHSYGRTTVETAALKVPTIGSNRVDSVRKLYPYTSVDPYDVIKVRGLITRLLEDTKFRDKVVDYAYDKVEYYSHKTRKKLYLDALYEETQDEKFKTTD